MAYLTANFIFRMQKQIAEALAREGWVLSISRVALFLLLHKGGSIGQVENRSGFETYQHF
jgi:hypothetical protein